jgi:TM2 domain-containing membrane protein YozV
VAEPGFEKPQFCARCGQPIVVADASFCKQCGAALTRVPLLRRDPGFNPTLALVLSIWPGLGHFYRGRFFRGVLWFFGVLAAYSTGPMLGILIHLICASNAAFSGVIREDAFSRPIVR